LTQIEKKNQDEQKGKKIITYDLRLLGWKGNPAVIKRLNLLTKGTRIF